MTSSGSYRSRRSSVIMSVVDAEVGELDRTARDRRVCELDTPSFDVRVHLELAVQAREMLFHRGLGDDELGGYRSDRRRLRERVARRQRAAQSDEHIALSRREGRWPR